MSGQDDPIEETTQAAEQSSAATSLFDIRLIIGGLFLIYGIAVFIAGLVDGSEAREKAADIDINIWTGLAMAATGVVFLVWMRLNPLRKPD